MSDPMKLPLVKDCSAEINRIISFLKMPLIFAGIVLLHPSNFGLSEEPKLELQQFEALRIIHREFDQHTERRTQLRQDRERMQATLNETEQEMRNIRDESLRKQMDLMQLQWEEASYDAALQDEADRITNLRPATAQERARENSSSRANQTLLGINQLLTRNDQRSVSLDLSQLESASRLIVQRRMKVFQDGAKWQQDVAKWIEERPKFFDRYWRFTDPSRILPRPECEAMLSVFKMHASNNYPAIIAQSLLEERLGQTIEARQHIDIVLKEKTPLHGVATAVRGVIHGATKEPKKANTDFIAALKIDRTNPYFRFLRARYNASQQEWKVAEDEATAILKSKELELDARRLLGAIYAIRAQKIPKYVIKAKEQARLIHGFTGDSEWYSNLLMAMALSVSNATDEALIEGEKSLSQASDEQKPFVESIVASIQSKDAFLWDFQRR